MVTAICDRPGCGRPLLDQAAEGEKFYLVKATGQVVSLRRCDPCAEAYDGDILRRVSAEERKRLLSPATATANFLRAKRAAKVANQARLERIFPAGGRKGAV